MERMIIYRSHNIYYTLDYKKVKNINLRIKPDGMICVSAPKHVMVSIIDEFVASKGDVILSYLSKIKQRQEKRSEQVEKQYMSGDTFLFVGNRLELKVIVSTEDKIYTDDIFLYLYCKNPYDKRKKERLITRWFQEQTKIIFEEIVKKVYEQFKQYKIDYPQLKIRKMSTKWGSCRPKSKIITLNSYMIQAPKECIEYVVIHEFCHFIHANHSKYFYQLMEGFLPDWKEKKKVLEDSVIFDDIS